MCKNATEPYSTSRGATDFSLYEWVITRTECRLPHGRRPRIIFIRGNNFKNEGSQCFVLKTKEFQS